MKRRFTMFKLNSNIRLMAIFALALVLAGATYAFAAANTVPASKAGDGSGAISGYTVSTIHYNLSAANPGNIDNITFTLNSAPAVGSTIKIKLVAAGSTWYSCTFVTTTVTCANGSTLGASVLTSDSLEVVVAD
jgi:hypothetical protein